MIRGPRRRETMSLTVRVRRMGVAGLLAVVVAAGAEFADAAKGPPAAHEPTLPEPLTKESVRELVARLSDDDVRKLLLEQLDRAAVAAEKARPTPTMAGMAER